LAVGDGGQEVGNGSAEIAGRDVISREEKG
jgi:hypothetical protein